MKDLSRATRAYLIAMYLVGILLLVPRLMNLRVSEPVMFVILCVLGSALHILKVEGATNRSHYTFSFLIFGFAILHLDAPQIILIILVSNLAEWVWNKQSWFIQLFNISCYSIAAQIAILIYTFINPQGLSTSWQAILGIVLGMVSFTLINHLIIGLVLWLARGENFKQSGIFGLVPLLIDLTMLTVGASLALVWNYNPYALFLFLVPIYPLYLALRIPALERQTEIDSKTGLFNHEYFVNQFHSELQRANRYDRPLSVIIADLDLLRNINNTYGHLAGDEVLKGVSNILKQTVREYDIVARFGGEEFAILMPETAIEKALERAEAIRKAVLSARFVVPTSVEPIKATMSFGVAQRENFRQSQEEILHQADTALYRSKLSGRNRSLASMNGCFLSIDPMGLLQPQNLEELSASQAPREGEEPAHEYPAASQNYLRRAQGSELRQTEVAHPAKASNGAPVPVRTYISLLALIAALAAGVALYFLPATLYALTPLEWMGFAAIVFTIVLTEWFSIDLYVRNTSVSTSAIPILALVVLFGPLGTLMGSAVYAVTAAIKFRSPFNRFVFNLSNHILAGLLINFFVHLASVDVTGWQFLVVELALVIVSSLALFLCTTTLISVGIGLDHGQSAREIWQEQYRWLIPFHVGMGFISFAIIFGYAYAGVPGILTMLIPIMLLRLSQAQYVEHTRAIVNEIRQKNQELEKAAQEINGMNEGLLMTLSEIIDLRDPHVLGHSRLVSQYATGIATQLGLNEKQVDLIRKASLLHDIGKLGIPMEILSKPGGLTPEEYEIVKHHAAMGSELVKYSPSLLSLAPVIRHHHESYNGQGYPDQLSGTQISIEARIVAVADAIEVMKSDRPYRKALKTERVIEELKRHSGTQFDPLVVREAVKFLEASLAGESKLPSREVAQVGHFHSELARTLHEGMILTPESEAGSTHSG